jgi:hypothetical protein
MKYSYSKIRAGKEIDFDESNFLGISIDEDTAISGRALAYYGLKGFNEGAMFTPYLATLQALLSPVSSLDYRYSMKIPISPDFNRLSKTLSGFLAQLYLKGAIERESISLEEEFEEKIIYGHLHRVVENIAPRWANAGREVKKQTNELGLQLDDIKKYSNIEPQRFQRIVEGNTFAADIDVDNLEKVLGGKIIKRYDVVSDTKNSRVYSILEDYCKRVLNGWNLHEDGRKVIDILKLSVPDSFQLKVQSPGELLHNAAIHPIYLLLCLIEPQTFSQLKELNVARFAKLFMHYGIVEKNDGKYEVPPQRRETFNYAVARVKNHIVHLEKYMAVMRMKWEKSPEEIATLTEMRPQTVKAWLKKESRPYGMPVQVADVMRKIGIIDEERIELLKSNGLINE